MSGFIHYIYNISEQTSIIGDASSTPIEQKENSFILPESVSMTTEQETQDDEDS